MIGDFLVKDSKGFDEAQVTAGGIDIKDIDSMTLSSKLSEGLFFCGRSYGYRCTLWWI